MEKEIRLMGRKDLDAKMQHTILKLKGSLIAKGYTEIIHILDQDEDFHINSFEVKLKCLNFVIGVYISDFLIIF